MRRLLRNPREEMMVDRVWPYWVRRQGTRFEKSLGLGDCTRS